MALNFPSLPICIDQVRRELTWDGIGLERINEFLLKVRALITQRDARKEPDVSRRVRFVERVDLWACDIGETGELHFYRSGRRNPLRMRLLQEMLKRASEQWPCDEKPGREVFQSLRRLPIVSQPKFKAA